jgi:hypothetical protein
MGVGRIEDFVGSMSVFPREADFVGSALEIFGV